MSETPPQDPLTTNHQMALPKPPPPPGAIVNARGGWVLPRQKGHKVPKKSGTAYLEATDVIRHRMKVGSMTFEDVQKASREHPDFAFRAAALDWLQATERADLADFDGAFSGDKSLSDLRAEGVNTSLVKKIKIKKSTKTGLGGDVTEEVSGEIELHNRRTEALERILDRSIGKPTTVADIHVQTDVSVPTLDFSALSPSELERLLELTDAAQERLQNPPAAVDAQAVVTDPQQAPQAPPSAPKYQMASPEDVEIEDAPDVHPKAPVARVEPLRTFEYQMPMPIAAPPPDPQGAKEGLVARRLRLAGIPPKEV